MTATHDDNATTWHDLADPAWRATGAGCPHGDRLTATDPPSELAPIVQAEHRL